MCFSHRWDVVLCLWGGERHGRHGHHDWLISGVDSGRRSLRARPYGGCVRRDGGPRRLHLSPLEKLMAACEREREKREKGQQTLSKPPHMQPSHFLHAAMLYIRYTQGPFLRCFLHVDTFLTMRRLWFLSAVENNKKKKHNKTEAQHHKLLWTYISLTKHHIAATVRQCWMIFQQMCTPLYYLFYSPIKHPIIFANRFTNPLIWIWDEGMPTILKEQTFPV